MPKFTLRYKKLEHVVKTHHWAEMRVLSFDVGIRNLAYAVLDVAAPADAAAAPIGWQNITLTEWEHIDVLEEAGCTVVNSKNVSIQRCIKMLIQALDKRPQLLEKPVDYVVIEKQVRKAPRNLMTSVALLSYFVLKAPDTVVDLVSATGKLKVNLDANTFPFSTATPSQCHYVNQKGLTAQQNKLRRKKKAVEITEKLLHTKFPAWKSKFNSKDFASKRDDLADCFLQGIYFLQDKHKVRKRKAPAAKKATPAKKRVPVASHSESEEEEEEQEEEEEDEKEQDSDDSE